MVNVSPLPTRFTRSGSLEHICFAFIVVDIGYTMKSNLIGICFYHNLNRTLNLNLFFGRYGIKSKIKIKIKILKSCDEAA